MSLLYLTPLKKAQTSNWTPVNLTNLDLFVNSGLVTPPGGPVTSWNDQSGLANNIGSWGSYNPTIVSNGFSTGIDSVNLTGLAAGTWAYGSPAFNASQPFMIAMVIKGDTFDNSSAYYTLQALGSSTGNPYINFYYLGSAYTTYYTFSFGISDASTPVIGSNALTYSNWNYIYVTYNGAGTSSASNYQFWLNGVQQTLGTNTGILGAATGGHNTLGNGQMTNSNQAQWAMNIVVSNHLPSNTEKSNLDAYVKRTYGLGV